MRTPVHQSMSRTAQIRRKKQLIHWGLQSALVRRAMYHWLLSLISITACTLLLWLLYGGTGVGMGGATAAVLMVWKPFAFALLGALAVLPVIVIDLLKITNRVAGPLVKLNNRLTSLGRGEKVAPIGFREKDYCRELAESFNAVRSRVNHLETQIADLQAELTSTGTATVTARSASSDT